MKWNEWFEGNDLSESYGKVPMSQLKVSLSKWLEMSENESPYQNDQIQWDLNELKWNEWNEVKWVIWRNWLEWTLWESTYELRMSVPMRVTWMKVKINVPIKMNGID